MQKDGLPHRVAFRRLPFFGHNNFSSGRTIAEILQAYPYLEADDIQEALAYAAWRVEEQEVSLEMP